MGRGGNGRGMGWEGKGGGENWIAGECRQRLLAAPLAPTESCREPGGGGHPVPNRGGLAAAPIKKSPKQKWLCKSRNCLAADRHVISYLQTNLTTTIISLPSTLFFNYYHTILPLLLLSRPTGKKKRVRKLTGSADPLTEAEYSPNEYFRMEYTSERRADLAKRDSFFWGGDE